MIPDLDTADTPISTWKFWGTSIASISYKEANIANEFITPLFGTSPNALNFNMLRYRIGGIGNPTFNSAPGHRLPADFDKDIKKITIENKDYWVFMKSRNRGLCDFNNSSDWQNYAISSQDPSKKWVSDAKSGPKQLVPLYCLKNIGKDPSVYQGQISDLDIDKCYNPSLRGWVVDSKGKLINAETGNQLELLKNAVLARGNQTPLVEAEALAAPYSVMDSNCEAGHDFDFDKDIKAGKSYFNPQDAIHSETGQKAFAAYISSVVKEINKVLTPLKPSLKVSSVEAFNSPFHYQYLSDSGFVGESGVSWTIEGILKMSTYLKSALPTGTAVTGFDDDALGEIKPVQSTRLDGGHGNFWALLQDRDTNASRVTQSMSYISTHLGGPLIREMAALARINNKYIASTGYGCCVPPGTWGGNGKVSLGAPGGAPMIFPWSPTTLANSTALDSNGYPKDRTTGDKNAGLYWMSVDKQAYLYREMIKYLELKGWHYLSPGWGLFDVAANPSGQILTTKPKPAYFLIREYVKALPPGSKILKVADDNIVAATYTAANKKYLSLIIYNGSFEKKIPTQCASKDFPCGERGIDSLPEEVAIKENPRDINYQIDLSNFGITTLNEQTPATITVLRPDSRCQADTYQYSVSKPVVLAQLYYAGCPLNLLRDGKQLTLQSFDGSVKGDVAAITDTLPIVNITTRIVPMNEWNYMAKKMEPGTRLGLKIKVAAHSVYFIKIPLPNPPVVLSNTAPKTITIDDGAFDKSEDKSNLWTKKTESTFKYWKDSSAKKDLVDSKLFTINAWNNTFTESSTKGARLKIAFDSTPSRTNKTPARIKIYGVQRPLGAMATIHIIDDDTGEDTNQYSISTYAEYQIGNVLLFDSGNLSGKYRIEIINQNGGLLTLDSVQANMPLTVKLR